jgi:hypothetical protein
MSLQHLGKRKSLAGLKVCFFSQAAELFVADVAALLPGENWQSFEQPRS